MHLRICLLPVLAIWWLLHFQDLTKYTRSFSLQQVWRIITFFFFFNQNLLFSWPINEMQRYFNCATVLREFAGHQPVPWEFSQTAPKKTDRLFLRLQYFTALGKNVRWAASELVTEGSQSPHVYFLSQRIKKKYFYTKWRKNAKSKILKRSVKLNYLSFPGFSSSLPHLLIYYYLHRRNETFFFLKKNKILEVLHSFLTLIFIVLSSENARWEKNIGIE